MTIEEVKKEYFRIAELLKKEALTGDDYNFNCAQGYSTHFIKRDLGLSYNGMKKLIGAKLVTSDNRQKGITKSNKKIFCARGEGSMISIIKCVPGCSDVCHTCKDKQLQNRGAGGDTLTPEEDREAMLIGTHRSSGAIAVEEGYSEI